MRRKTTRKRSIRPQGGLANPLKIGYTSPCGAEFFRCVGGTVTCSGCEERQLLATAAVLFCTLIVPYALIQYYPLLYLLGRTTSLWNMVMPLFAVIFLIPCYALWRVGVRHYKSSGS